MSLCGCQHLVEQAQVAVGACFVSPRSKWTAPWLPSASRRNHQLAHWPGGFCQEWDLPSFFTLSASTVHWTLSFKLNFFCISYMFLFCSDPLASSAELLKLKWNESKWAHASLLSGTALFYQDHRVQRVLWYKYKLFYKLSPCPVIHHLSFIPQNSHQHAA